jgi:hypothetical protein
MTLYVTVAKQSVVLTHAAQCQARSIFEEIEPTRSCESVGVKYSCICQAGVKAPVYCQKPGCNVASDCNSSSPTYGGVEGDCCSVYGYCGSTPEHCAGST